MDGMHCDCVIALRSLPPAPTGSDNASKKEKTYGRDDSFVKGLALRYIKLLDELVRMRNTSFLARAASVKILIRFKILRAAG